jgi:hypothetical protein
MPNTRRSKTNSFAWFPRDYDWRIAPPGRTPTVPRTEPRTDTRTGPANPFTAVRFGTPFPHPAHIGHKLAHPLWRCLDVTLDLVALAVHESLSIPDRLPDKLDGEEMPFCIRRPPRSAGFLGASSLLTGSCRSTYRDAGRPASSAASRRERTSWM